MKRIKKIIAGLLVVTVAMVAGCKRENIGYGYMAVKISEARTIGGSESTALSGVNIDIKSVEVHYANEAEGSGGWVTINTNSGIYDLLLLQNDIMATIADDTKLPAGKITQLRLVLGPNNAVVISGDSEHFLKVPSAEIKINVDSYIPESLHLSIALEFDADKSIVIEGSGEFNLKPVIQVKSISVN